jgi:hypothetical protein
MPLDNASNYTLNLQKEMPLIMGTEFLFSRQKKPTERQYISVRQGEEYRPGTLNIQSSSRAAALPIAFVDSGSQPSIKVRLVKQNDGSAHPLVQPLLYIQQKVIAAYKQQNAKIELPPFMTRKSENDDYLLKLKGLRFCAKAEGHEQAFEQGNIITRFIINIQWITYSMKKEPFFWIALKAARIEAKPVQPIARLREDPVMLRDMLDFGESDDDTISNDDAAVESHDDVEDGSHHHFSDDHATKKRKR